MISVCESKKGIYKHRTGSDAMHISKLLDLEHNIDPETKALLAQAKTWGAQNLEPLIPKNWDMATFPSTIISSFREKCPNLLGYTLPKKYGGQGYGLLTASHISRSLASVDASFTTTLLVQYGLCAESILLCGTEEQRCRLIPSLANLQNMGCFCLTEPQSGSDASDLRTTATKVEGGYSITGSKRWIGNALSSEVFVVWAKNMSIEGNPVMGFIVQRSHQENPNSIQTSKIEGKVSMRMLQNANVEFCNAFCPNSNVMGNHVGRVLEVSRISVAWIPVGICQGAVEKTIEYATHRRAFGAYLSSNQLIQGNFQCRIAKILHQLYIELTMTGTIISEKLVRMTAMTSSMYLLVERMTRDYEDGKCSLPAISMVKAYNTKLGREVVALCRETLGGNGIVLDHGIASKWADLETTYTYEGTYEVCSLVAGRALTGVSAIKSASAVKSSFKGRQRSKL
eukprot:scaffold13478_cov132-Cylindrotheca_fusiformis.AAC.36